MTQGMKSESVAAAMLLMVALAGCGESNVVVAQNGPPARPLQTGQTNCYDTNGNTIACAGTGQDGAFRAGVARRYVDNGDGTITDMSTGLMWEKKSADFTIHDHGNAYMWADAFGAFIGELNAGAGFAGHTDWRIPNVNELLTLVNYQNRNPAVDLAFNTSCAENCTVLTCSCTQVDFYWSSTTYQSASTGAWIVSFFDGGGTQTYKGESFFVRAVRGGL